MKSYGLVVLAVVLAFALVGCQKKVNWFPKGKRGRIVDWEAEKKAMAIPTDMIVVHHTAAPPGMTWETLSDIGLNKFFAPCFDPKTGTATPPDVRGMRVQSNHFRDTETGPVEVYYTYHWLIREDGKTERLLKDDEVGWHAGDMQTNCRSIAIVFDGDYSDQTPPDAALLACAKIIVGYKQQITRVIGHREVTHEGNPVKTICPGNWWLSGGKGKLLAMVGMDRGEP